MKKLMLSSFLVVALLAMTVGTAFAQTSTVTGTVQSAEVQTDAITGNTTVLVTYTDDLGATQTVRLSVATAESLGLVTTTPDPTTGLPLTTVNDGISGLPLTVNSTDVIADPTTTDETQHPVASKLADFFGDALGVDYDTIMAMHEDGLGEDGEDAGGFGFGVIAQALWMTKKLDGDTDTFKSILEAKSTGDYSSFEFDDGSTPTNWGQFKKAVLDGDANNSLGDVMSGKGDAGDSSSELTTESSSSDTVTGDTPSTHGNSGESHGNNKGNKGKGKGHHGHP